MIMCFSRALLYDKLICVLLSSISRCMEWGGPAPRLAGDLRLIRGLFLAHPHWHHTVPPTCCLRQPTHLSQQWARHSARPTTGNAGLPQATKRGERTHRPNTSLTSPCIQLYVCKAIARFIHWGFWSIYFITVKLKIVLCQHAQSPERIHILLCWISIIVVLYCMFKGSMVTKQSDNNLNRML